MQETASQTPADRPRYCTGCDYDLRGTVGRRCPECGLPWEEAASSIPWARRKQIGRIRAFGRTVWMVSIRPRELTAARGGPVPYRDAQRFRRWVILLATIPLFANLWIRKRLDPAFASMWQFPIPRVDIEHDPMGSWFWQFNLLRQIGDNLPGAMPVAVILTAAVATACTDVLFRVRAAPIDEANRAVVAGVYTCAPLAWIGLAAIINSAEVAIEWTQSPTLLGVQLWLELISGLMAATAILLYFLATARALKATTNCLGRRLVASLAVLFFSWMAAAFIAFGPLPAVIGLLRVMWETR